MNNLFGQHSSQTEVNPNASPITQVNPRAAMSGKAGTVVNPNAGALTGGSYTQVNPNATPFQHPAQETSGVNIGKTIDGKYTLISRMITNSGEADIYICTDNTGRELCLKHYGRLDRIKEEVRNRLRDLRKPFVAELIDWGYWNDKIYEVWPIYSHGSLADKRLNDRNDETKLNRYIAQMNAALHAIHQKEIVHQDIKPSNFMLDENENLVLIDFGVSAILDTAGEINRTHVTEVGGTSSYKAPEVRFDRRCGISSDYYSMGVTIYSLLFGTTPYENYEAVSLTTLINVISKTHIPQIETLSTRMQHLLTGLLQYEKSKRWSFEAVSDWLNYNYQKWIIPIEDTDDNNTDDISHGFTPIEKKFKFDGNLYSIPSQLPELVINMAYRWSYGQNLFGPDGRFERLKEALKDVEGTEDIYAICNAPKQKGEDDSLNYFRKLYQLYPGLKLFTWKQYQYENKTKLGEAILNTLWAKEIDVNAAPTSTASPSTNSIFRAKNQNSIFSTDNSATYPSYAELLFWMRNGVVSQYLRFTGEDNLASTISQIESTAENNPIACYTIAYMLSKSTKLRLPSGTFTDKEDFLRFVRGKIEESERVGDVSVFLNFCRSEIYDGKTINTGFQAWIASLGLGDTLSILTDPRFAEEVKAQAKARTERSTAVRSEKLKADEKRASQYIEVICPGCGQILSFPDVEGFGEMPCPHCGTPIDPQTADRAN